MSTGRLTEVVLRRACTMSRRFRVGFARSLVVPGALPAADVSRETSVAEPLALFRSAPDTSLDSPLDAVEDGKESGPAALCGAAPSPEALLSVTAVASASSKTSVALDSPPAVSLLNELSRRVSLGFFAGVFEVFLSSAFAGAAFFFCVVPSEPLAGDCGDLLDFFDEGRGPSPPLASRSADASTVLSGLVRPPSDEAASSPVGTPLGIRAPSPRPSPRRRSATMMSLHEVMLHPS